MLTDLLAFLSVLDFDHKRPDQIRAVKLKELIEDIQMRKRFIGFIGPQSDADLESILNESLIKSWLAKSSKAELELFSTSVKRLYVKEGIVMSALGSLINQPLRAYSGRKLHSYKFCYVKVNKFHGKWPTDSISKDLSGKHLN